MSPTGNWTTMRGASPSGPAPNGSERPMKLRSSSSLVFAIAVVLAFVLGSVGTATAGPALSKKVVKKIAAQVVKKAAPTLSVAHAETATTATNATNLNGLPADAYLGRVAFAGGGGS